MIRVKSSGRGLYLSWHCIRFPTGTLSYLRNTIHQSNLQLIELILVALTNTRWRHLEKLELPLDSLQLKSQSVQEQSFVPTSSLMQMTLRSAANLARGERSSIVATLHVYLSAKSPRRSSSPGAMSLPHSLVLPRWLMTSSSSSCPTSVQRTSRKQRKSARHGTRLH